MYQIEQWHEAGGFMPLLFPDTVSGQLLLVGM